MAELLTGAARESRRADELAAATTAARALAVRLRAVTRGMGDIASVDGSGVGERWYSPVYGPGSPVAPPLRVLSSADGRVRAEVTVAKPHEGPPGLAHGGTTATLLDHVLARAVRCAGHCGLTATLTVTYRRPVRLGVPLLLTAELVSVQGRRATARATVVAAHAPDAVLAEAEGLFVALRPERAAETFAGTAHAVSAWTARP